MSFKVVAGDQKSIIYTGRGPFGPCRYVVEFNEADQPVRAQIVQHYDEDGTAFHYTYLLDNQGWPVSGSVVESVEGSSKPARGIAAEEIASDAEKVARYVFLVAGFLPGLANHETPPVVSIWNNTAYVSHVDGTMQSHVKIDQHGIMPTNVSVYFPEQDLQIAASINKSGRIERIISSSETPNFPVSGVMNVPWHAFNTDNPDLLDKHRDLIQGVYDAARIAVDEHNRGARPV